MADKRWKATERRIAALLGGRRVPVSGRGRGNAPDIAHPWLALEVKDRPVREGVVVPPRAAVVMCCVRF